MAADPGQKNWKGILIAILVIGIILAGVAVSVVILTPPDDGNGIKGQKFSIEHIQDPKFLPRQFNGSWISGLLL